MLHSSVKYSKERDKFKKFIGQYREMIFCNDNFETIINYSSLIFGAHLTNVLTASVFDCDGFLNLVILWLQRNTYCNYMTLTLIEHESLLE